MEEKMVTKAEVTAAAEALAKAQEAYRSMGMMNQPLDPQKRVESQAAYYMARDAVSNQQRKYDSLFTKWADAGFPL